MNCDEAGNFPEFLSSVGYNDPSSPTNMEALEVSMLCVGKAYSWRHGQTGKGHHYPGPLPLFMRMYFETPILENIRIEGVC